MSNNEYTIGIHFGHDATVCLMEKGVVLEAMSEERLSRQKKHAGFPILSLDYIKKKYNIEKFKKAYIVGSDPGKYDYIFETQESNKIYRRNQTKDKNLFFKSVAFMLPIVYLVIDVREKILLAKARKGLEKKVISFLKEKLPGTEFVFVNHHLAHAYASTFFFGDSHQRLIFTLDGEGDGLSGSVNLFRESKIEVLKTIPFDASLGMLYSAFTELLGMKRNEHEFKVMGLAPYAKKESGEKVYKKLKELIWFDQKEMTFKSKFPLKKVPGYLHYKLFFQYRFDSLAYGVQKLTEELFVQLISSYVIKYDIHKIAIGGGVFMNVKANQKILEMPEVEELVVTPSSGDESLALGAAAYGFLQENKHSNQIKIENLYLGSEYSDDQIKIEMERSSHLIKDCSVKYFEPTGGKTIEQEVAKILSENSVVGRFKGRAEWGARALGNRSILANPKSRDNVKIINEMIKNRDFWMPFATSLLYERRDDYLLNPKNHKAYFMDITFNTKIKAHADLQAALHPYDLTSRPQMVTRLANKDYHNLISEFEKITGIGGVLNTSFNLHGEPNVETPFDSLRTFALSAMPHLAIGNYLISKSNHQ